MFRLVHGNCTRCILHVRGLVHENYTRCILHVTGFMLILILTVGKKHYCYSTYSSQLCLQTSIVSAESSFFSFLLVLHSEFLSNLLPSLLMYLVRVWVAQSDVLCSCLPAAVSSTHNLSIWL